MFGSQCFLEKLFCMFRNDRETTLQLARIGRVEVVLTTFETARTHIDDLNGVDWDCVIVDEVHKIKDPKSKVSSSILLVVNHHRVTKKHLIDPHFVDIKTVRTMTKESIRGTGWGRLIQHRKGSEAKPRL